MLQGASSSAAGPPARRLQQRQRDGVRATSPTNLREFKRTPSPSSPSRAPHGAAGGADKRGEPTKIAVPEQRPKSPVRARNSRWPPNRTRGSAPKLSSSFEDSGTAASEHPLKKAPVSASAHREASPSLAGEEGLSGPQRLPGCGEGAEASAGTGRISHGACAVRQPALCAAHGNCRARGAARVGPRSCAVAAGPDYERKGSLGHGPPAGSPPFQ